MKRVTNVPALAFVLGALTVGAVFAGQAGWAALTSHAADAQIFACVKTQNGQVRVVAAGSRCLPSEHAATWSVEGPKGDTGDTGPAGPAGPQGPPGESGGTAQLSSPNGLFRIEIEDDGIFIRGPRGTAFVDFTGVGETGNPYYGK